MAKNRLVYVLFLCLIVVLTSCHDEIYEPEVPKGPVTVLTNGKLRIPLSLSVSSANKVEIATRSAADKTGDENTINTAWVLVFEATNDANAEATDRLLQLQRGVVNYADYTDQNSTYVDLYPSDSPCRIIVAANLSTRQALNIERLVTVRQAETTGEAVTTFQDIGSVRIDLGDLYHDPDAPGGANDNLHVPFPMSSGLVKLPEISVSSTTNLKVDLKFCFARLDVYATNAKANFNLKGARLLNGESEGALLDFTGSIVASSTIPYVESPIVNRDSVYPIYLFEKRQEAADVLIRGDYTAPDGTVYKDGFYKIRVLYSKAGGEVFDINRNTLYAVRINAVNGPGYATEQDAIDRNPHNVDYAITVSDNISQDHVIANGEYYLGVSNSEYILYADEASGVPVVTLTHNAPATIDLPKISLEGTGLTFYKSDGLTLDPTKTQATLPAGNGSDRSYVVKLNMTEASAEGRITVRVGNLLKTVILKKKAQVDESQTISLPKEEFGGADFEWVRSESDRISVGSDNSLTINPQARETRSNRVISEVKAFDADQRGSVVIAVKRNVSEVVYYEKYADGTYGFYFEPIATLVGDVVDTKEIAEAGYGILKSIRKNPSMQLSFGNDTHNDVSSLEVDAGFTDYAGVLFPINQNAMRTTSTTGVSQSVSVVSDQVDTRQYIHPNFAKAVYSSLSIPASEEVPFVIRTPLQFQNITKVNNQESFRQETDLDFNNMAIGGSESFSSSIVTNRFAGRYEGSGKMIQNLSIATSSSNTGIFNRLGSGAIIQNLRLRGCIVSASNNRIENIGLLVGNIEASQRSARTTMIDNVHLERCSVIGFNHTGGVVGHVHLDPNNIDAVLIQNSSTDALCSVLGNGYANTYGTGGIVGEVRYNTTISNCVNRGSVSTRQYGVSGGICGNIRLGNRTLYTTIRNCENYGTISGGPERNTLVDGNQQHASVGGILGHSWDAYTAVESCVNYGGIDAGIHTAGGIVGHMYHYIKINDCHNHGDFTAAETGSSNYAYQHCGGIVGWIEGANCSIASCTNTGYITGATNIGGIVGHSGTDSNTPIEGCSNYGQVHSLNNTTNTNYTTGGISGTGNAGISRCLVVGSGDGASPFISGGGRVGGIVGSTISGSIKNVQVVDARSNTTVPFLAELTGNGYAGGIAGYCYATSVAIEDACVIDARDTPNTPFAHAQSIQNGRVGGITGSGGNIRRVLFLGAAPTASGNLYPISTDINSIAGAFFLQGESFNNGTIAYGVGQNTATFSTMTLDDLSTDWVRVDGYPYPKLHSHPVPDGWPKIEAETEIQ